jgi:hypothetical protein
MTEKSSSPTNPVITAKVSSTSELDIFWKDCGKKMILDSIEKFDE